MDQPRMLLCDAGAADFAINGRASQAELPGGHGWRQTRFNQLERDWFEVPVDVVKRILAFARP